MMVNMDNKQLVHAVMDALTRSDKAPLLDAMAEEVRWRWMGTAEWSKTFEGKSEVVEQLFGAVEETLSDSGRTQVRNIIAEGDHVAVEHSGQSETPDGRRYDNNYCWIFTLSEGRITEIREYMDTQLVAKTFSEDS